MGATVPQRAKQALDLLAQARACLADVLPADDKRLGEPLEQAAALMAAAGQALWDLEAGGVSPGDRLEFLHRLVASVLRSLRELERTDDDSLRRIYHSAASNGLDAALVPWLDLAVAGTASDRAEAESRMLALLLDEGLPWPEAVRRTSQVASAAFMER